MSKTLAIWVVFAVLESIACQQLIGKDYSTDNDLLVGGAIILHSQRAPLRRADRVARVIPEPAPKGDGIFSDVEMEIWNMQHRLIAQLQGTDQGVAPLAKLISVE